jgi:TP901 family phage tail tape measure protein
VSPLYNLAVMISWVDKMTGPAKKTFAMLKNQEQMINKGQAWAEYGKNMSVSGAMVQGAADRMIGSLRSILGPSEEVNDSMASLETVTTSTMGSIDKSMAASKKAAIQWSKIHANSAAEFGRTSYMMASAGLNDIQAIEGTKTALAVATGTMGDAAESANLLAILYNNLGDKSRNVGTEMTRLGDIVTKTQQYFQFANLNQLTQGLTYATPSALQFGSSIEEVNTVLGLLNNAGLQGSMAGTAYAATMRQMMKASNELGFAIARNDKGGISLIKTVENIRKKYGDFNQMSDRTKMAFQKAFGDEGIRAISLLMGKTDEMDKALQAVTNSAGAAAKAQRKMELKSPTKQYQILKQNIDAVKISIADNLLPSVIALIPQVTKLLDKFGQFVEKHPGLAKLAVGAFAIAAGLLAIVAPIMSVTGGMIMMTGYGLQGIGKLSKGFLALQKFIVSGKLASGAKMIGSVARTGFLSAARAAWTFTSALLANPITWIVVGVVALAAGAYLLIRNWSAVKAFFTGLWTGVIRIWSQMPGWLKNLVNGLLIVFMPFIGIPLLIVRNWERIKTFFLGLWDGIISNWTKIMQWAKMIGVGLMVIFAPFIGIPLLVIANWKKIGPAVQNVIKAIGNWFANLGQSALKWGSNLLGMFIEGIKQKIASLKNGLTYTANQIKKFLGFHSPAEAGPGADADRWAPNLMNMYQSGIVAGAPGLRKAATTAALGISMAFTQASAPAFAMPKAPAIQQLPVQTVSVQPQVQPLVTHQIPIAVSPELQSLPVQTVGVRPQIQPIPSQMLDMQPQVQPLQPLMSVKQPLTVFSDRQPFPAPSAPVSERPFRPERPAVSPVRIQIPPAARQPSATQRPTDVSKQTGKQRPTIVIKGNVTITANNPEDLWQQLQQLTAEEGDDE